jgi:glycosyltransferase involved in cell wall biosynthesis
MGVMPEPQQLKLFLVGTEFFRSTGGIQCVNRMLWRAFADIARRMPCSVEIFSFGDCAEAPPAEFARIGFAWHAFGRNRLAMAARLGQRALAAQPHVVLFTHAHLIALAQVVQAAAPGSRLAALGHGIEVWEHLSLAQRAGLARCRSVVAPSRFTREKLIAVNGVPAEVCRVIPHGLPPEWSAQACALRDASRPGRVLLSVARMNRADAPKGLDVVLRAMPRILRAVPEARCLLAGDGDDRPRLECLARELGVANRVEFRGELRQAELAACYREADVFVLPSWKEGFGIVFLEAMWHALPVVAARAGGAVEAVEDDVTGLLLPPDSPEQTGAAVSGLLLLDGERRRLGEAGRRRVLREFLFEHFTARWENWLLGVAPEALRVAQTWRARLAASR